MTRYLPFRWWRGFLGQDGTSSPTTGKSEMSDAQSGFVKRLAPLIENLAHRVPFRAVCLQQAIAGRWVLMRRGIGSSIKLGSTREQACGTLSFHAWLIAENLVVTGNIELPKYRAFETASSPDASMIRETWNDRV